MLRIYYIKFINIFIGLYWVQPIEKARISLYDNTFF